MPEKQKFKNFPKYIGIIGSIISVIAVVLAVVAQIGNITARQEYIRFELADMQEKLINTTIEPQIEKLIQKQLSGPIQSLDLKKINNEISNLKVSIQEVDDKTLALRQAINPTKPDEILKIARLTDSINGIKKELDAISSKNQREFDNFKSSLLRELDASNKATNLILVVLIPLVLNLIYNFWKDRKQQPKYTINEKTAEQNAAADPGD